MSFKPFVNWKCRSVSFWKTRLVILVLLLGLLVVLWSELLWLESWLLRLKLRCLGWCIEFRGLELRLLAELRNWYCWLWFELRGRLVESWGWLENWHWSECVACCRFELRIVLLLAERELLWWGNRRPVALDWVKLESCLPGIWLLELCYWLWVESK